MISFRLAIRAVAATALIGGAFGEAEGQTANSQRPQTPTETAKAIANTFNATTPKAPGALISFESATSHNNIVEMRYVVNDAAAFVRLKSSVDQMRLAKTSYYCNESRVAYLKQGVVMHEVIATSNNSDQIEITFDKSSCDSLPKAKLADPKTLAELALAVAKAENDTVAKLSNSPFQLNGATAHQGIVDERFIVLDASAQASVQANRGNMVGVARGYLCTKYRDVIFQGLVFHHFFVLADGSPVIDFTIDRTNC